MRCKGCGYSLWNVPGRTCPECGRGFAPSEFEFRPNTVEFCCPGCMQQYYGTDKDGLPVPREFACVRCGSACSLDTMVLRLAPGATDDETEVARVPWERPGRGVLGRFWSTVRDGIGAPAALGKAAAAGADCWAAFRFALALLAAAAVPTALTAMVVIGFFEGVGTAGARTGGVAWRSSMLAMVGTVSLSAGGAIVGVLLLLSVAAALASVILRTLGRPVPWRVTWPVYAYSLGPMIFAAIPCLGPYCVAWPAAIWVIVAVTIALMAAVPESPGRVLAATLLPVAVAVLLGIGIFAWVVVPLMNQATAAAPPAAAATVSVDGDPPADEDAGLGAMDAPPPAAVEPVDPAPGGVP